MKKLLGILALALLILAGASCKTKAHCDAYSSMNDTHQHKEVKNVNE